MYFAVAGDLNDDYNQGFKHVVIDQEYYDEHVFKFLPYDTFCFNETSRPTISTMIENLLETNSMASILSLGKSLDIDLNIGSDLEGLKSLLRKSLLEHEKFVKKSHEKKLLGLAIEKQGHNMIALGPKCYTQWNDEGKAKLKLKGVQLRQNKHITQESYSEIIDKGGVISGQNNTLQMKNDIMSRLTINKIALTGKNNKGITCSNGCVMPFEYEAKYINS
jgi:hypothetical protein